MRPGKVGDDAFADALILIVWSRATRPRDFFSGKNFGVRGGSLTWFDELSKNRPAGFELLLQAQHGNGNAAGLGAGNSHNPDAATTRRRGDGDDGVVEIHREIV